nr:hypothetical protein [Tanacetum cinerariifolium]
MNTSSGIGVSTESDDTINEDTTVGVASAVKEGVTPSVVDMTMEMEKLSSLEDTIGLGSFPPLSTPVTNTAGNSLGKYSYANVTGKSSGDKRNISTLFTPEGNEIDVVISVKLCGVPVTTFNEDGLSVIATKLDTSLMLDSYTSDMCMQYWGRSSYVRVMIELRTDVELKDIIVIHIHEKCLKNTCAGKKKTVKKPSQTSRGVPVGSKMSFKPQKEYRHVLKKPTVSFSGNKKKGVKPIIKVSNSNPFKVLNTVNNDVELERIGYCWNDDEEIEFCDDGVDGFNAFSCWYDELGLRR